MGRPDLRLQDRLGEPTIVLEDLRLVGPGLTVATADQGLEPEIPGCLPGQRDRGLLEFPASRGFDHGKQ
jgi:hypothetical protein